MTNDLYQTLAMSGAYPGVTTQFGLPYTGLQNPAILQQLAQTPLGQQCGFGQQAYGTTPGIGAIHPHSLQLASLLAGQGGNAYLQNPWLTSMLHNPQTTQQNPYQQFGQNPYQQFGQNPYQQFGQNPYQQFGQNPYQQFGQQGMFGQQLQQNPLLQAILTQQQQGYQNPVLQAILAQQQSPFQQFGQFGQFGGQGQHNPLLTAILAQQHQNPYQQFGQLGSQLGQQLAPQLAPQTWIGQSPFLNPLAQLGGRGIQGLNPWIGI